MDYRSFGDGDYRRAYGVSGVPLPTLAAGSDESRGAEPAERAVPVWWIWVISLYCIPLAIANVCINNILLPPLITSIVGANAMVRNGQVVPPQSMALGVPATVREGVVPEDANMVNAESYVQRGREFRDTLRRLD